MTRLPDERAREVADAIDAYDQQLADAQEGKRETFQTLRIELENLGLEKAAVKAELDGLKRAIKLRQLRNSNPEKLDQVEAAEALAVEYLDRIEVSSRAPRATRTREARSKARTSEAMADHKELSQEMAAAGLISPKAHAENIAIADAVADKLGAGVVAAPISFRAPNPADFRPHCRNRETCAGVGLQHCFTCQRLADTAGSEAA